MNCEKCGAPLEEGTKFCPSCGAAVETASVPEQPAYTEPEASVSEQPTYTAPEQPIYTAPVQTASAEEVPQTGKGLAIASMVCGIASLVLCCFTYFALILSIAAIVLGIISKKKTTEGSGMALAGIITGAVGLLVALFFIIVGAVAGAAFGGMSPDEITHYIENL